jgi:FkbM family methyltransferase
MSNKIVLRLANRALKPFRYRIMPISTFRLAIEALHRSKKPIKFIQVGANDGVRFDDLYFTITSSRWSGLVIEPLPSMYHRLVSNYQDHPQVIPLNLAIHPTANQATIYHVKSSVLSKYPDYAAGIPSMFRSHLIEHGVCEDDIEETVVPCKSLTQVSVETGFEDIDVLQIDTEGFDLQVLRTIDFTVIKPTVIKFEWMNLSPDDNEAASNLLRKHGYTLYLEHDETDCVALTNRITI